jgi:hypothetical protein
VAKGDICLDIQEISLRPGQGWAQADLSTFVVNNPPAVPAQSSPFAYVGPDHIPRIIYGSTKP